MKSLILIAAFMVSAASAASTPDTPLKALQRIESLMLNQQKQSAQDRDELEAQDRCYKACRTRFGEWEEDDTPEIRRARQSCFRKCGDMPSPPSGC